MAKINEQYIVIKLSKLVKGDATGPILQADAIEAIGQIVEGAVGQLDSGVIVEIEKGE